MTFSPLKKNTADISDIGLLHLPDEGEKEGDSWS